MEDILARSDEGEVLMDQKSEHRLSPSKSYVQYHLANFQQQKELAASQGTLSPKLDVEMVLIPGQTGNTNLRAKLVNKNRDSVQDSVDGS